jgi:hypothetical protein
MSRKKYSIEENEVIQEGEIKENLKESEMVQKIEFHKALRIFRKKNISKAKDLEDAEVVRLFVIKYIPSLLATQEEWNEILKKF